MALPSLSFFVGSLLLAYLSTFVAFAILRITKGISIQRLSFSGLRRISFTFRDGCKVDVRGLSIQFHQPSFSQPTICSLVLQELKVTLDPDKLVSPQSEESNPQHEHQDHVRSANGHAGPPEAHRKNEVKNRSRKRGKTWDKLMVLKNWIKRAQSQIRWLKYIDVVAHKSSLVLTEMGTAQIETLLLSVDTRSHAIDRSRLFVHSRPKTENQSPAEWTISVRSLLFEPFGQESIEIMDHCVVNVHGFLYRHIEGLRDAAVFVKLGRCNVPYDEVMQCAMALRSKASASVSNPASAVTQTPVDVKQDPFVADAKKVQAFADAREFIASVLRGIREVSFAVSLFGLSKRFESIQPAGKPSFLSMSLKEFGLDFFRLDSTIPAQAMYFARKDVAHQALLSAISLSVGVDDGEGHPDRLVYVPMTTATVKTTLPAKLLQFATHDDLSDRNANILFANVVMTSPSLDFTPRHVPLLLALANRRASPTEVHSQGQRFFSRFLPKTNMSLSIQEPVIRAALPSIEQKDPEGFDFDLLVSSTSSLSLDIQSSHSSQAPVQYQLISDLRMNSHRLYYQTASKIVYDLLVNDLTELNARVSATPDVNIVISANIKTLSLFLVRPEITKGIRQILRQARSNVYPEKGSRRNTYNKNSSLRSMPHWLESVSVEATDFNFECAGLDTRLSNQPRGVAVQLAFWTAEYKSHREQKQGESTPYKRRAGSRSLSHSQASNVPRTNARQADKSGLETNRRRLAFHLKGLESFIIEDASLWEDEPFLTLPQAEIALTASSDGHGPILHILSLVKNISFNYSLFRHYCFAVAVVMLNRTFRADVYSTRDKLGSERNLRKATESQPSQSIRDTQDDFVVIDFKLTFGQFKASLPSDPHMMLHLYDVEIARHRYLNPFFKAQILRLYAQAPAVKKAWSRVASVKTPRVDMRQTRRKHHTLESTSETSFDFVSDAVRIGVPHQLVVHKIFDNIVNTSKTVAQLHHRFRTNTDDYILGKRPEGPKRVPRISLRTHVLLFELEESAFEWKLGVIFRAGLVEQKQRIAREEAFKLKCRSLDNASRPSRLYRYGSTSATSDRRRSRSRKHGEDSDEEDNPDLQRSSSERSKNKGYNSTMRYDKEGKCDFTHSSATTRSEAWDRLQQHNAQSWKKRVDAVLSNQHGQIAELRSLLWGLDNLPDEAYQNETILQIPTRPSLLGILMSDVNVTLDKPSFPMERCPDFLHSVGKGLPKDTQFSMLIPLNASFEMGECRVSLRDYPLPLLHIPAIKPGQSPRLPSWSLKTDFVIAEEFRDEQSTRDFAITVVPGHKLNLSNKTGGFAIDVRRTVSPVKSYSDIKMEINTARDTRFTWGVSYQPAIQDMMQVIEGFTKPQVDPSDRLGFWDKIRLTFHSRINVAWRGDGDVHLMLKGTRDPYIVTGYGAGFVMVFRNDVNWNIHQDDDSCKFMTVDSGDYVLAIPDFKHYARQSPELIAGQAAGSSSFTSQRDRAYLTKVIMKLSGKVRWQAGLVFERTERDGHTEQRSFNFKPHYEVTLRNPIHAKSLKGDSTYDAFSGFRSDHLHLSIAIAAPENRDWKKADQGPASNYNSVHLTPRFFTHFFAWWSMFSGVMSLPVRQGPLYPAVEKSGKKFGRHIATIKYSLLLSPLFLSHIYKHKEAEEFANSDDEVAATGLKARLDSFMLDIHQRREQFKSEVKGLNKSVQTTGMRINQALLDLLSTDIRAVSATISGTSTEAIKTASASRLAEFQNSSRAVDLSSFTIPDNDLSWIDVDDFVEIDWTLPEDADPKTRILPLTYAPRFTYRRNTDHQTNISGDRNRESNFGNEPTHVCYSVAGGDPHDVQISLLKQRIDKIDQFISEHGRTVGEYELLMVRETSDKEKLQAKLHELRQHSAVLDAKKDFLINLLTDVQERRNASEDYVATDEPESFRDTRQILRKTRTNESFTGRNISELIKSSSEGDNVVEFNNRFIVHNPHIKWTNSLRDIMLRYLHQVSQRRGYIYYQSRKAVKFILDIVEEQRANGGSKTPSATSHYGQDFDSPMSEPDDMEVQDRIEQLLRDGKKFVDADDPDSANGSRTRSAANKADQHIAHGFVVQNAYHVKLVAPQIQFQSQKNPKSAMLLTARGIRLKVLQIMDEERLSDEISGLVQRRFTSEMENTQFFVTQKQSHSVEYLHMFSHIKYGASLGTSWPPWVPLEVVFDFDIGSFASYGFSRVVQKTSASLRFDKYNQLRLKYNDNVSDERPMGNGKSATTDASMDHLWVDFPRLRAICDSSQYYTIYTIIADLLLYSEPLEKMRNEKLEKIMLASDFSDLSGAPEIIINLQDRIRQLEEIKTHFHINERFLDRKGWQDRIGMEQDLAGCEDELFFMMKAITSSQRKTDERVDRTQAKGMLRYDFSSTEIVWHLTREPDKPLAEFQLRNATFERIDNSDGSNKNSVEIDKIRGLNLLPGAIYPEIISPHGSHLNDEGLKMLRINWHMLEAIAGIPVMDTFEINLHPLQIQFEYETGRQLFDYVFPGRGVTDATQSPFLVKHRPLDFNDDQEGESSRGISRGRSFKEASRSPASSNNVPGSATGAGSLEHRLVPTHVLPDNKHPNVKPSPSSSKLSKAGLSLHLGQHDFRKMFDTSTTKGSSKTPAASKKSSNESLKSGVSRGRPPSTPPPLADNSAQRASSGKGAEGEKRMRFALPGKARRSSSSGSTSKHTTSNRDRSRKSDELAQMLDRAGNYMTLAYVRIPSVILCLSYKGRGNRNFEDIHNLVFTMPTLEYRNKLWSNLDLVEALKKDVFRALIHHTGTIIGNKFSHQKPGRNQSSRLREIASSSAILSGSSMDVGKYENTSGLRGTYDGRMSVDTTGSFTPSLRFSDTNDDDVDGRRSASSYSRSTHAPPSSYASSLAPTPESPELAAEDGSDSEKSQQPALPRIHVQRDDDTKGVEEDPHSNDLEKASTSSRARKGLSRHFSDFTHKASTFRRSDTGDGNNTPNTSRRGSWAETNGNTSSPGRETLEDGGERKSGSGLTPKRTLRRILKRDA